MSLSNTATPIYYGQFRDAVMRGEIPVCREVSLEMNRIEELIANPGIYYDDEAVNGFIAFCENELTLTNGEDLHLLDTFKLWAEQIFGWYYYVDRSVYVPNPDGYGGRYVRKSIKYTGRRHKSWAYPTVPLIFFIPSASMRMVASKRTSARLPSFPSKPFTRPFTIWKKKV